MGTLFAAFVARLTVRAYVKTAEGKVVIGKINSLQKEDGAAGRNFIVHFDGGESLYFCHEADVIVALA